MRRESQVQRHWATVARRLIPYLGVRAVVDFPASIRSRGTAQTPLSLRRVFPALNVLEKFDSVINICDLQIERAENPAAQDLGSKGSSLYLPALNPDLLAVVGDLQWH